MLDCYCLFRYGELAYPAYVLGNGDSRAVKPLVRGPKVAAEGLRQREIVGVIDRPLAELTGKLQRRYQKPDNLLYLT